MSYVAGPRSRGEVLLWHAMQVGLTAILPPGGVDVIASEVLVLIRRFASLPVLDGRSAEEIVGYDEHGVPQ